jgi:hypothetical protein
MSSGFEDDFSDIGTDDEFDFDAVAEANAAPAKSFDAIKPGWYRAIVSDAIVKPNKAGTGRLVQATIEILDSEYDGRRVWHRFNFENPNEQAQEIGRRELGQAAKAAGLDKLTSPRQLIDRPLQVRLAIEKYNGEEQNVVKGWKPA